MAVTKTILKKAKHEVVVKFANDTGSNQTSTFDLDFTTYHFNKCQIHNYSVIIVTI